MLLLLFYYVILKLHFELHVFNYLCAFLNEKVESFHNLRIRHGKIFNLICYKLTLVRHTSINCLNFETKMYDSGFFWCHFWPFSLFLYCMSNFEFLMSLFYYVILKLHFELHVFDYLYAFLYIKNEKLRGQI